MEQSQKPEAALENAHLLKTLVPGSEHLIHMPSHIYFRTGQYHEGSESNLQSISTDNSCYRSISRCLFERGHPLEAMNMYEQDLKQYPKNGWALFGLVNALRKLKNNEEAERIRHKFKVLNFL